MVKIAALLIAIIMAFSFTACGGRQIPGRNAGAKNGSNALNAPADTTGNSSDTDALVMSEMDQSWPTSTIYDVPEWKGITRYYGKVKSLDDFAGSDNFFLLVDASVDSYNKYLDTLRSAGYQVTDSSTSQSTRGCSAEKGLVRLDISRKKISDANSYQIDFDLRLPGAWPKEGLPGFLAPLEDKILVNDPDFYKPGDNLEDANDVMVDDTGYNFQFTYSDISMDEAIKYMYDTVARLQDGSYSDESVLEDLDYNGFGFIKGTYPWEGKKYYVYGEVVRQDKSTYNFFFGWSLEDQGW